MQEIFKDIVGYEGKYQISNLGNVKSLRYNKTEDSRLIKQTQNRDGYIHITLCKDSLPKILKHHRIIALAFIDNPDGKSEINHINGIKADNRIENLEWCTRSENINHAYKMGLNVPFKKKCCQYDLKGNFIKTWDCMLEASISLGIEQASIVKCCKGRLKRAGRFTWRYFNI